VLQCVAVSCSELQCVAVCCSIACFCHQPIATHCSTLQRTGNTLLRCRPPLPPPVTHNVLQCAAVYCRVLQCSAVSCRHVYHTCEGVSHLNTTTEYTATHCNALRHTATHCHTLRHTATHCDTLQHTATHCKTHRCITHCKAFLIGREVGG